jgi:hypothetical protein
MMSGINRTGSERIIFIFGYDQREKPSFNHEDAKTQRRSRKQPLQTCAVVDYRVMLR